MNTLQQYGRRPALWLPLALLVLTLVGAGLLLLPQTVQRSERDWIAYGARPYWQASFDALSAATGVGLLTYDLHDDYTPAGRWVLMVIGVLGACAYLVAAAQVVGRHSAAVGAGGSFARRVVLAFVAWLLVVPLLGALLPNPGSGFVDRWWDCLSAFASLGWVYGARGDGHLRILALLALLSAAGWPVWLLMTSRAAGRVRSRLLGTYLVVLLALAAFMAITEGPRGRGRGAPPNATLLSNQPLKMRLAHTLTHVTAVAGAGLPTENLEETAPGAGAKLVTGLALLVGGVGGGPGGGIKWSILATLIAGGLAIRRRVQPGDPNPFSDNVLRISVALVVGFVLITLVTAGGLLILETATASVYQPPPTLGDAWVDAAALVAGGAVTTGLIPHLTAENLSSGMWQSVDLYQYGMAWAMLAMFVGRVFPVVVLAGAIRASDASPAAAPPMLLV